MKTFKYIYDAARHEWVGVVTRGTTVITVTCEETENDILRWWQIYQAAGIETDMYDRGTSRPN